jgi:hypothetical protein
MYICRSWWPLCAPTKFVWHFQKSNINVTSWYSSHSKWKSYFGPKNRANQINIFMFCKQRPPLRSSGKSSRLDIQRSGFDYRHYQIYWKMVGLERGPLSLVSTTEELLDRKSSGSGLESQYYGCGDALHWQCDTPHRQTLALTSSTSGGRSVGIVHSRTKATEFACFFCFVL